MHDFGCVAFLHIVGFDVYFVEETTGFALLAVQY